MSTNPISSASNFSIQVRPYVAADQPFVLGLAPRLVIGIPSWRDPERMLTTVQQWLTGSIEQHGTKTNVFIAVNEQGEQLGFASVSHSQHFTGVKQAYIGELAVSENVESRGVGQALVEACEQWATNEGYAFLCLETGTANERARRFYQHLGFLEEDVRLVKLL